MKKTILSVFMLIVLSLSVDAQIKVSRQYTPIDLDIKVKRCVVSGTQGYIDLVFTNYTGTQLSGVWVWNNYSLCDIERSTTAAYDDEGNVYYYENSKNKNIYQITFGGGKGFYNSTDLPEEVPVKMRIDLKNISEYATEFTMLNLVLGHVSSVDPDGVGTITFRNIPITRVE
jgi:hypothetical protein